MIRRIMSKDEQLRLAATIKTDRDQKLRELGHMIRGGRTPVTVGAGLKTKGASGVTNNNSPKPKVTVRLRSPLNEKQKKLSELGKMIRS